MVQDGTEKNRLPHSRRKGEAMRGRWLWYPVSLAILGVALAQGKVVEVFISFGLGLIAGFLIDVFGIKVFRLWEYPRQQFLSRRYFLLVWPGWGLFGIVLNLVWAWMGTPSWITFIVLTLGLFLIFEGFNLVTKTWRYHAPAWLIIGGWILLIFSFRILFLGALALARH